MIKFKNLNWNLTANFYQLLIYASRACTCYDDNNNNNILLLLLLIDLKKKKIDDVIKRAENTSTRPVTSNIFAFLLNQIRIYGIIVSLPYVYFPFVFKKRSTSFLQDIKILNKSPNIRFFHVYDFYNSCILPKYRCLRNVKERERNRR